ncbi:MAG: hypothetical protein HKN68_05690, partial [Saprospiraceae bacterium]|nr:hypothetical protein [Saprospiraceae bacterium]
MKRLSYNIATLIFLFIALQIASPSLSQDPYGISEESRWPYGPIYSVAQYGDMVYYGNGSVLMIYNISDPNNPVKMKEKELETVPIEILAENDQLFIAQEHYGLYIYDLSNPANPVLQGKHQNDGFYPIFTKTDNLGAFSTSAGIELINLNDPTAPVKIGNIEVDNRPRSLAFHKKYLYVGMYDQLLIYDVSDPSGPTLAHSEDFFYVPEILIIGDEAYIGQSDTMRLLDISDDRNPVELNFITDNYSFTNLVYNDGLLYTSGAGGRVQVYQRNGNDFQLLRSKSFEGYIEDMIIKDDILLCASLHYGLEIIDVSDVNNMSLMHTISTFSFTTDVKPHNGYIYAAQGRSGLGIYQKQNNGTIEQIYTHAYENTRALEIRDDVLFLAGFGDGFIVLNISNPVQPMEISRTDIGGTAYELDVKDDILYLANGKEGFSIFNISNLSNPVWLSTLPMEHIAVNVRYHDGFVYVSDYRDGLKIVDVSDPTRPRLKSTFKTDRDNEIYVGNVFDVEIMGQYAF